MNGYTMMLSMSNQWLTSRHNLRWEKHRLTTPAATLAGGYSEAPKICFYKFWGGKCTRGSNCEFHGPDSDKLEREAHTKYIEILDMHERCTSDSDVKLVKRPKDARPKRKHRVRVIEEAKTEVLSEVESKLDIPSKGVPVY
jgi:hypothetical protein